MRILLFGAAALAPAVWTDITPATAASRSTLGMGNPNVGALVENVGYRRRYLRRYGYPVPYAYYPPGYGYYPPPYTYAYPAEGDYVEAPPPDGDYVDAPLPDADYGNAPSPEGAYVGAPTPEDEYVDSPPPEDY